MTQERKYKTYIPLHGHTSYSISDGVSRIPDIMSRAKELECPAIGVSEHGNMSSFYKFYISANKAGIKPILGCEYYINDSYFEDRDAFLKSNKRASKEEAAALGDEGDYNKSDFKNTHLVGYAKNYEGLNNLIHLNNFGYMNFYRKPLVSTEKVFEFLDSNNIVTTACLASKFNKLIMNREFKEATALLQKFKDKFGDDFYIELHVNELEEQKLVNKFYDRVAPHLGIKRVLALDYHYVYPEDWQIQYLQYVIRGRKSVRTMPESEWFYELRDLYIKSIDEVYDKAEKCDIPFDVLEEAIQSTFDIAEKCDVKIPKYQDNYPRFTESKEESEKIFDKKVEQGWSEKTSSGLIPADKISEYKARLDFEINIMKTKGVTDYFLILDDLINNFVIPTGGYIGAGRGSAAGSLVLYVLGITKVDPIKYGLIFERFLNSARKDPPDVDMDIDTLTQKKVEQYLIDRWGYDKVCHIANFGKFGTKTIIKDLCRVYELDFNLSNRLTALFNTLKSELDIEDELKNAMGIAKKMNDTELLTFIDTNWSIFVDIGSHMLSMIRQMGRHASGILISNKDLIHSNIPISLMKDGLVTGVQEGGDEREVTELGYLKLDILGLIAARINGETMSLVETKYNLENLESQLLLSDFDDELVYKEFEIGNTKDIFQFGSDSMIDLIKRIKPSKISDLCAINALFRPALISNGGIEEYITNMNNPVKAKKQFDKIHPDIWPLLEETYGIPLYQESIMFILQKIGDFTMDEADGARKTLKLLHKGNQGHNQDFLNMIEKFKERAMNKGVTEENVQLLLDTLAGYSEYSFNKSHSFCYALNAYISMWLKVHYPKEYYATLLNYSDITDMSNFINQASQKNVKFSGCTLGHISDRFAVDYDNDQISFGLSSIKGVRTDDIEKIPTLHLHDSKLQTIKDVLNLKLNKKSIEVLCRLGFFTSIHPNRYFIEQFFKQMKNVRQSNMDDEIKELFKQGGKFREWTQTEQFTFEKEYLGFYLSEHPFTRFFEKLLQKGMTNAYIRPKDIEEHRGDKPITMLGLVSSIQMLKGKKSGKEYYKIVLEDDESQVNITLFDTESANKMKEGNIISIEVSTKDFGITKTRKSYVKVYPAFDNINNTGKMSSFEEIEKNVKTTSWF